MLVRALSGTLKSAKVPKMVCSILEFTADFIKGSALDGWASFNCNGGDALLTTTVQLAASKHADVRQLAVHLLTILSKSSDASAEAVEAALDLLPASAAAAIATAMPGVYDPPQPIKNSPHPSPLQTEAPVAQSSKIESSNGCVDPPNAGAEANLQASLARLNIESDRGAKGASASNSPAKLKSLSLPANVAPIDISADATCNIQSANKKQAPSVQKTADLLSDISLYTTVDDVEAACALAPSLRGNDLVVLLRSIFTGVCAIERGNGEAALESCLHCLADTIPRIDLDTLGKSASILLEHLLPLQSNHDPSIAYAAKECTKLLASSLGPVATLSHVMSYLPKPVGVPPLEGKEAVTAAAAVTLVGTVFRELQQLQLAAVLSEVAPSLCFCYSSGNLELRRVAADGIVAAFLKLGAAAMAPHLQTLSSTQLKLIEVYTERAQRAST
jgi:hypothetical protein